MTNAAQTTSTGHALSGADWLDAHFESARAEYEDGLRFVGIQPGWKVLDAGCGGGGFLPLMVQLAGSTGAVDALDLAPENIDRINAMIGAGKLQGKIATHVGSMLALPYPNETFDCVWSANVMQYLTANEFDHAMVEFKRVLKPNGHIAIKEFDSSLLQYQPFDPGAVARQIAARKAQAVETGLLGPWSGPSMPSRLRRAGLQDIRRKTWFVERWQPVSPAVRQYVSDALPYMSRMAAKHNVPASDIARWEEIAANPLILLDDPDFCLREGFVVAVGRVG